MLHLVWIVAGRRAPTNNSKNVAAEQHLNDGDATFIGLSSELQSAQLLVRVSAGLAPRPLRLQGTRTHSFAERLAVVHSKSCARATGKTTEVLVEGDPKQFV